jgi:hypothetical protein
MTDFGPPPKRMTGIIGLRVQLGQPACQPHVPRAVDQWPYSNRYRNPAYFGGYAGVHLCSRNGLTCGNWSPTHTCEQASFD